MIRTLNIRQKGLLLVSVPLFFELIFVITLGCLLYQSEELNDRINDARSVLLQLRKNQESVAKVLLIVKALSDTSTDAVVPNFSECLNFVLNRRKELESEAMHLKALSQYLAGSQSLLSHEIDILKKAQSTYLDPSVTPATRPSQVRVGVIDLLVEFRNLGKQIMEQEKKVQMLNPAKERRFEQALSLTLLAGAIGNSLLVVTLSIAFSRDFVDRLKRISYKAELLSNSNPLGDLPSGVDEIYQLETVIHESEQLLEETRKRELMILDNAADVICSLDKQLKIIAIGASCRNLWHYTPDDLTGKCIKELMTDASFRNMGSALTMLRQGRSAESIELETDLWLGDGSTHSMLWNMNWVEQQDKLYCAVHDITQALIAESSKRKLVAMVCHDLRNPLSSSGFGLEVVLSLENNLASPVVDKLSKIASDIHKMVDLITLLLDLEKFRDGKFELEYACVSANDLCSIAADQNKNLAKHKRVRLDVPFGDASINGDEPRLVQSLKVFLNFIIMIAHTESAIKLHIGLKNGIVEIRMELSVDGLEILPEETSLSPTISKLAERDPRLAFACAVVSAHFGTVSTGRKHLAIFLPEYETDE